MYLEWDTRRGGAGGVLPPGGGGRWHRRSLAWRYAMYCAVLMVGNTAPNAQAQAAGQWRDPATLFQKTCAYCHDQSLVKGIGPELLGRGLSAAAVAYFVRHGAGAMPAFPDAQISSAELAQLGQWIAQSPVDSQGKKP